jgi:hypothetical protein
MEIGLFNIFFEAELMFFDDEFCYALRDLLNDKLAKYLVGFIREAENTPMIQAARDGLDTLKRHALPRANVLLLSEKLRSWPVSWMPGMTAYDLLNQVILSDAVHYAKTAERRNEVLGTV